MGIVVAFEKRKAEWDRAGREKAGTDHAERVARFCRCLLLDRKRPGIAYEFIAIGLGLARAQVAEAVERLRRAGRAETAEFRLRTRPHVVVTAVCRIDDVGAHPSGQRPTGSPMG
jgi:hypothetical protein